MNPKPAHKNRRRSHSLLRWSDVQVALTLAFFATLAWLAGYCIGELISIIQTIHQPI